MKLNNDSMKEMRATMDAAGLAPEFAELERQRDMLLDAMNTFTPAIDRVLWIAPAGQDEEESE